MLEPGEIRLAQADGSPPTALAAGYAPGESGVSILSVRFRGGAHFSVTARQHVVCFVSQVRIECSMAGRLHRRALQSQMHDVAMRADADGSSEYAGEIERATPRNVCQHRDRAQASPTKVTSHVGCGAFTAFR